MPEEADRAPFLPLYVAPPPDEVTHEPEHVRLDRLEYAKAIPSIDEGDTFEAADDRAESIQSHEPSDHLEGMHLLREALDRLLAEVATLQSLQAKARDETFTLRSTIDRLHAENQELRRGEVQHALAPMYRDLIKLSDDWSSIASSLSAEAVLSGSEAARHFADAAEDALIALERHGVTVHPVVIGALADRRLHQVTAEVETNDPGQDRIVLSARRPAYTLEDRVLTYAKVTVSVFRPFA